MISKASAIFERISPRKARVIVDLVRGKSANDALQCLEFTRKAAAPIIKRLLESALANAQLKQPNLDTDELYVSRAFVNQGPSSQLRRWRPRAMGRATPIVKGVSHIHVELDQR